MNKAYHSPSTPINHQYGSPQMTPPKIRTRINRNRSNSNSLSHSKEYRDIGNNNHNHNNNNPNNPQMSNNNSAPVLHHNHQHIPSNIAVYKLDEMININNNRNGPQSPLINELNGHRPSATFNTLNSNHSHSAHRLPSMHQPMPTPIHLISNSHSNHNVLSHYQHNTPPQNQRQHSIHNHNNHSNHSSHYNNHKNHSNGPTPTTHPYRPRIQSPVLSNVNVNINALNLNNGHTSHNTQQQQYTTPTQSRQALHHHHSPHNLDLQHREPTPSRSPSPQPGPNNHSNHYHTSRTQRNQGYGRQRRKSIDNDDVPSTPNNNNRINTPYHHGTHRRVTINDIPNTHPHGTRPVTYNSNRGNNNIQRRQSRSRKKFRLMSNYPYTSRKSKSITKSINSRNSMTESRHSESEMDNESITTTSIYTTTTGFTSPEHERDTDGHYPPCDGDPFWDYYRTIGDISRANSFELINVMKFISAEHIIKFFLQNWLQTRIEPTELPFANNAILGKMQYTKRKRIRRNKRTNNNRDSSSTVNGNKNNHAAKGIHTILPLDNVNEISEDDMNIQNGNHLKQSENLNPPSNHPRFLSHNRTESLSRKNLKEHNKMLQPYKFQLYSDLKSRKSTAKSFTMSESGTYKFDLMKPFANLEEASDEDIEESDDSSIDESNTEDEGFSGIAAYQAHHNVNGMRNNPLNALINNHNINTTTNGGYYGKNKSPPKRGWRVDSVTSSVISETDASTVTTTMKNGGYGSILNRLPFGGGTSSVTQMDSIIYSSIDDKDKKNPLNMDLNLNTASLTKFIRQSLKLNDDSAKHPNYFNLPKLTKLQRKLRENGIAFLRDETNQKHRRRNVLTGYLHFNEDDMNEIGSKIFSFCDQKTFLSICIVSRSWFYCSRFETSRSHIQLRLFNVLKYLIKHKDLLNVMTSNNNIISVDEMVLQQKVNKIKNIRSSIDSDSEFDDFNSDDDPELRENDILLSCINKESDMIKGHERKRSNSEINIEKMLNGINPGSDGDRKENSNDVKNPFNFPYFFSSRTQCLLFSNINILQIDLTILTNNSLMYYIDQQLYDCYWEMSLTLFRIECLREIDLILPDPHILLLSYMLTNMNKVTINKSELKFPSIGIPKNKFLCISKVIQSLSFKCKSLSTSKLYSMLDTHFEHYYHPKHHPQHPQKLNNETASDSHFIKYVRQQSTSLYYKSLETYQLCRKTIQKPLIFDITHAFYYLNRRPSDEVNTVQKLIMSDVRCTEKELQIFLTNNSNSLKHLEIQFSEFCIFPIAPHRGRISTINTMSNHIGYGGASVGSNQSARSNKSSKSNRSGCTGSGSSSRNSKHDNCEDTGFPDITVLKNHHSHSNQLKRTKSSTQMRIMNNLNEIFNAILEYLNKAMSRLHEYNHRIRKKFQTLKKKKSNRDTFDQQFSSSIKVLPLNTFAVSFPTNFDDDYIHRFFEVFKVFETPCDEISISKLYLNGSCIHPHNLKKLNWINIFQSQHIETLYLRQMIYVESYFDNLSKLWTASLINLELSLSFSVDDNKSTPSSHSHSKSKSYGKMSNKSNNKPIKRLFLLLEKCHRLESVALEFRQKPCYNTAYIQQYMLNGTCSLEESRSNSLSAQQQKKVFGTPLPQLPLQISSESHHSSNVNLNDKETPSGSYSNMHHPGSPRGNHHGHNHHKDYHLMEPVLDIWWIHHFMTSKNIKKTIKTLKLTFNELSTKKFENNHKSVPKYTRWNQAHGQILRISDQFKNETEQLIMSWFGECSKLIEIRLLRKLSTLDRFDTINDIQNGDFNDYNYLHSKNQNNDKKQSDFDLDISCFDDNESYYNHLNSDEIHDLVLYNIKKWKVVNTKNDYDDMNGEYDQYKGHVVGELEKLLMPEIPIG